MVVATVLRRFRDSKYVDAIFYGLRPASTGLIAAAGWSVIAISLLDLAGWRADGQLLTLLNWRCILLAAVVLLLTRLKPTKKLHPVVWILLSAAAGIVFQL